MADYEDLIKWAKSRGLSYDEPLNEEIANKQIEKILDFAKSKSITEAQKSRFDNKPMVDGIGNIINYEMIDLNKKFLDERNTLISKATTLSELENARTVDINYLDSTFEKIRTIAETRQEELFESQIDEAREMIVGVGSAEEIRDILRTIPSEIRDKVGAKQKLDRLIRAGLEEEGTKIGRL